METFNKNWLAILLIVLAFTAIGFLLGWTLRPPCDRNVMFIKKDMQKCCDEYDIPLTDDALDSLKDINVEVKVTDNGDVVTEKREGDQKVVVKKVIKKTD